VDFLIFLLLFVVLCGWLDNWATRAAKPAPKEGR
jgi:hypothetical protein